MDAELGQDLTQKLPKTIRKEWNLRAGQNIKVVRVIPYAAKHLVKTRTQNTNPVGKTSPKKKGKKEDRQEYYKSHKQRREAVPREKYDLEHDISNIHQVFRQQQK